MFRDINKVILIGHIGANSELKALQSGKKVCIASLATNYVWKDKTSGEFKQKTQWHRVVIFNRLAEVAYRYLVKGIRVYVEGSLHTHRWKDKDGIEQYSMQIIASRVEVLIQNQM